MRERTSCWLRARGGTEPLPALTTATVARRDRSAAPASAAVQRDAMRCAGHSWKLLTSAEQNGAVALAVQRAAELAAREKKTSPLRAREGLNRATSTTTAVRHSPARPRTADGAAAAATAAAAAPRGRPVSPFRTARSTAGREWSSMAAARQRARVLEALDLAMNGPPDVRSWLRPRAGLGAVEEVERRSCRARRSGMRRPATGGSDAAHAMAPALSRSEGRTPLQMARASAGSRWANLDVAVKRARVLAAFRGDTAPAPRWMRARSGLAQPGTEMSLRLPSSRRASHAKEQKTQRLSSTARPSTAPAAKAPAAHGRGRLTPFRFAQRAAGNSWALLTAREQRGCVLLTARRTFDLSAADAEEGGQRPVRTWLRKRSGMAVPEPIVCVSSQSDEGEEEETGEDAADDAAGARKEGTRARATRRTCHRARRHAAAPATTQAEADVVPPPPKGCQPLRAKRVVLPPVVAPTPPTLEEAAARLADALNESTPLTSLPTQLAILVQERRARTLLNFTTSGGEVPKHARATMLARRHFVTNWRAKVETLQGGFLVTRETAAAAGSQPWSPFTLLERRPHASVALVQLPTTAKPPRAVREHRKLLLRSHESQARRAKRAPRAARSAVVRRPEWMDWIDTCSASSPRSTATTNLAVLEEEPEEPEVDDSEVRVAKLDRAHKTFGIVPRARVAVALVEAERALRAARFHAAVDRAATIGSLAAAEANTWARLASQYADRR